jgi:hypothetical protein
VINPLNGCDVAIDEIFDEENVTHLLSITIDPNRPPQNRCNSKPGNPTLVFYSELPISIDTRLSKIHCPKSVNPVIIVDILVTNPFGAPIGGMKI